MAQENAKRFLETVRTDETLRETLIKMSPDEGLAHAKELGFDFTKDELKAAAVELLVKKMQEAGVTPSTLAFIRWQLPSMVAAAMAMKGSKGLYGYACG